MISSLFQNVVLFSTPDSRKAGKLSALACLEVLIAFILYWWVAVTWQTQIHIFISLIAAPLYLLRSEESVDKAQKMWVSKEEKFISTKLFTPIFITIFILGLLFIYWLFNFTGVLNFLFSWLLSLSLIMILVVLTGVVPVTGFSDIRGLNDAPKDWPMTFALSITLLIVFFPIAIGIWLRSLYTRIFSVLFTLKHGFLLAPENWNRTLFVEDSLLVPVLIPEAKDQAGFDLGSLLQLYKAPNRKIASIIPSLFIPVFFLPALVWRLSLKSTVWFYFLILLIGRPGGLADSKSRKIQITSEPPLHEKLFFWIAIASFLISALAAINLVTAFDLLTKINGEAPFIPIAWLLVVDWRAFFDEPWKWFSLLATVLTIVIYFRVDLIRKRRDGMYKIGINPDDEYNLDGFVGTSIYWMDRVRNIAVLISFIIGLWYFTKFAYINGQLTPLDSFLMTIFG